MKTIKSFLTWVGLMEDAQATDISGSYLDKVESSGKTSGFVPAYTKIFSTEFRKAPTTEKRYKFNFEEMGNNRYRVIFPDYFLQKCEREIKFKNDVDKKEFFDDLKRTNLTLEDGRFNGSHFSCGIPNDLRGIGLGYVIMEEFIKYLGYASSNSAASLDAKAACRKLAKDPDFWTILSGDEKRGEGFVIYKYNKIKDLDDIIIEYLKIMFKRYVNVRIDKEILENYPKVAEFQEKFNKKKSDFEKYFNTDEKFRVNYLNDLKKDRDNDKIIKFFEDNLIKLNELLDLIHEPDLSLSDKRWITELSLVNSLENDPNELEKVLLKLKEKDYLQKISLSNDRLINLITNLPIEQIKIIYNYGIIAVENLIRFFEEKQNDDFVEWVVDEIDTDDWVRDYEELILITTNPTLKNRIYEAGKNHAKTPNQRFDFFKKNYPKDTIENLINWLNKSGFDDLGDGLIFMFFFPEKLKMIRNQEIVKQRIHQEIERIPENFTLSQFKRTLVLWTGSNRELIERITDENVAKLFEIFMGYADSNGKKKLQKILSTKESNQVNHGMKHIRTFAIFENEGGGDEEFPIPYHGGKRIGRLVDEYAPYSYYPYFKFENYPTWVHNHTEYGGDFDFPYDEFIYNNFFEMDADWGHPNSYFGTRGLGVGDPKRTSRSYDMYANQFGRMIVRVRKNA